MEAKGVLQIGGMESRKFAGRPNCRKAEGQPDYQPGEDPGGSGESGSTPNGLLLPAPPIKNPGCVGRKRELVTNF